MINFQEKVTCSCCNKSRPILGTIRFHSEVEGENDLIICYKCLDEFNEDMHILGNPTANAKLCSSVYKQILPVFYNTLLDSS